MKVIVLYRLNFNKFVFVFELSFLDLYGFLIWFLKISENHLSLVNFLPTKPVSKDVGRYDERARFDIGEQEDDGRVRDRLLAGRHPLGSVQRAPVRQPLRPEPLLHLVQLAGGWGDEHGGVQL